MKLFHVSCVLVVGGLLSSTAFGDLANGSFTVGPDGLDGWSIDDPFFGGGTDVAVEGAASFASLGEGSVFVTPAGFLSQTFTLSNDPLTLSFEFDFSTTPGGTSDPFRFFDDFMNVGLSKTGAGDLFVDGFGFGSPVFLTYDGSGVVDDFGGGTVGSGSDLANRYELDLSGLGLMAGDELTLLLAMASSDDGFVSAGLVDNIVITAIPAPGSAVLAMTVLMPALFWRKQEKR